MKSSVNMTVITTIMLIFMLSSCSSVEDITLQHPYLSQLTNTECLNSKDIDYSQSRSDDSNGSFEMVFEGNTAKCKFTSLEYPCDFEKVNVNVFYSEGVLTIVEYPSSDKADCRCEISASFLIENVPQLDFILKIYHGDTTGRFNPDKPLYEGEISLSDGKITFPY